MSPDETFKPLGIISILFAWIVIGILLFKFKGHKGMSISQHAAAFHGSYLMMAVMESLALPVFSLFMVKWFAPTWDLPNFFMIGMVVAAAGILIAGWIPDTAGWQRITHRILAYGSYLLFIPLGFTFYVLADIPLVARIAWLVALGYMIWCLVFFLFKRKTAYKYHLYLQAPYLGLFHLAILTSTYLR